MNDTIMKSLWDFKQMNYECRRQKKTNYAKQKLYQN